MRSLKKHAGFYGDGYDVQIARLLAEAMGKKPVFVNIWNANFPMWYNTDVRFRFIRRRREP